MSTKKKIMKLFFSYQQSFAIKHYQIIIHIIERIVKKKKNHLHIIKYINETFSQLSSLHTVNINKFIQKSFTPIISKTS